MMNEILKDLENKPQQIIDFIHRQQNALNEYKSLYSSQQAVIEAQQAELQKLSSIPELKPCPCCECHTIISEISYEQGVFRIYCEECPVAIELSFEDAHLDKGEVISFHEARLIMDELTYAWNRRADNDR